MASNIDLNTQTALAKKSGVSQSTIGRILRGDVNPQAENLENIAKALGLSYADLAAIAEGGVIGSKSAWDPHSKRLMRCVPLLSWLQVKMLAEFGSLNFLPDAADWIECPSKQRGSRTVALKVSGESMEPEYQHGDIIYVDPDIAAVHGKDVVVFLSDTNESLLKRLVVESACAYLRPLNPTWLGKVLPLANKARILGVVVGRYAEK